MRRVLPILVLALGAGCASESAALRAAGSPYNAAGSGAYYEINTASRTMGDVKVWSNGVHEEHDLLVVEIGMRIRNNVDTPMTVDASGCGLEVQFEHGNLVVDEETAVEGDATVAPGAMARITIRYTLPPKTKLDDITGFDFYWRLGTADGPFSRSTAFQRVQHQNGYYYYPYFGSPFWPYGYGPWGPSFGFGVNYYHVAPRPYMRPMPPRR